MGSESVMMAGSGQEEPHTVFAVTGFKSFCGMASNPTEELVRALPAFLQGSPALPPSLSLPPGCVLGRCTVLETAGKYFLPALRNILHSPYKPSEDTPALDKIEEEAGKDVSHSLDCERVGVEESSTKVPGREKDEGEREGGARRQIPPRVIWVHLGVNGGAWQFAIEQRAVNEATFSCPDEMGWQPHKEAIVQDDGPITFARETSLPVDGLLKSLRGMGYNVAMSRDAGKFVCNYVYYHSLRFSAQSQANVACIFVHVPPFQVTRLPTQLAFVASLLKVLGES